LVEGPKGGEEGDKKISQFPAKRHLQCRFERMAVFNFYKRKKGHSYELPFY
jgi:hypothetical protein